MTYFSLDSLLVVLAGTAASIFALRTVSQYARHRVRQRTEHALTRWGMNQQTE